MGRAAIAIERANLFADAHRQWPQQPDEIVFSCFGKYCPYSAFASAKAINVGIHPRELFCRRLSGLEGRGLPGRDWPERRNLGSHDALRARPQSAFGLAGRFSITSSTMPNSWACSALMNVSRSMRASISVSVWPVWRM